MQRVQKILGHVNPSGASNNLAPNATSATSPDDIVIVSALRTAIGRARKGSFKDTHPTDLLAAVLKGTIDETKIAPSAVGDIVVGSVLAPGGFATQARMAMFLAGFPNEVPISTVNRQCSSGLQAFASVAAAIKAGFYDVGIAAGVESMTKADMMGALGELNDKVLEHEAARACLNSMGQTSENVAEEFNVTRLQMDTMAAASNQRAVKATKEGMFKEEIVPVTTQWTGKDGVEKTITVTKDDGPRAGTTVEKLARLRAAFKENGTTTAGNSSQTSDGAAAVMLMTRAKAESLGLKIKLVFKDYSVVGVRPEVMGIGPAVAIPDVCAKVGIKPTDVDIYELNEAFASQATYCVRELGISKDKVNIWGGAIALGHPLGCTGARQIATLTNIMEKKGSRYGCVSMCIGTGMGAAAIFERQ